MVPKRTKVFICKVSFICASPVAGAWNKNTLQDELFPNCAAQERNPYKTMLIQAFHLQGFGVDSHGRPSGQSGGISSRGQQGDPNFSGFTFTPVLGHVSSVEDRQRFFERKPYQPTAEIALVIKSREMARGPEQTIFYGNSCSVRISKHAICDKIQQAVISRRPNVKRNPVVH